MDQETTRPFPPLPPPRDDQVPATTTRRRRGSVLPWLVLAALLVALFWWHPWRRHAKVAPAAAPPAVATAPVAVGDFPVVLTELGTVTPLATVTVQSQISGYLTEVAFTEGQDVRKGDLLAMIDPRPYQVQLEQYQAQLARDTASLAQAQMDLARYQTLGRQQSIATQTLEDQRYTVAQDQATLKVDQAQIDAQKLNLAYCHIVAPVDGRVGLRQVDAGNYVTASETNGLVVLTQIKPISVIFTVAEDEIQPILERLRADRSLAVDAYDRTDTKRLATGTVETIDNQVDTSTGTVKLRANFANDDERLFPNEFVNAHLHLKTLSQVLLAPTAAVQNGPEGPFLYAVEPLTAEEQKAPPPGDEKATGRAHGARAVRANAKVSVRLVKTGPQGEGHTVILSGIAPGTPVVTDGVDRLKDGAEIVTPTAPPGRTDQSATPTHG